MIVQITQNQKNIILEGIIRERDKYFGKESEQSFQPKMVNRETHPELYANGDIRANEGQKQVFDGQVRSVAGNNTPQPDKISKVFNESTSDFGHSHGISNIKKSMTGNPQASINSRREEKTRALRYNNKANERSHYYSEKAQPTHHLKPGFKILAEINKAPLNKGTGAIGNNQAQGK
jgi:hypothetical protein